MKFSVENVTMGSFASNWSSISTTVATTTAASDCHVCGALLPCQVEPNLFEFVMAGVLLNMINSLGIVCNIISIFVLCQKQMRVSINCCLVGLASFDIVLLVCSIVVWGVPAIGRYTGRLHHLTSTVIPQMTPWLFPLATIAHTGSTYATLTVTVERYVVVCHSLKARYLCTFGRAKLYMLLITVFVVLYNIPKFFEIELQPIVELPMNVTRGVATCPTPLRSQQLYIEVYIMWLYLVVMYCVPFGALLVLNALIYNSVRRANKMRQLLSRRQQKEIGLATMLFAIVMLFMTCNSLSFVINIIEVLGIKNDSYVPHRVFERMADFSNLLININSSSNFIIYCIFGQKFRRIFLRLFCGRLSQRWRANDEMASCMDRGHHDQSIVMKRFATTPVHCCHEVIADDNPTVPRNDSRSDQIRRDTTVTRINSVASSRCTARV